MWIAFDGGKRRTGDHRDALENPAVAGRGRGPYAREAHGTSGFVPEHKRLPRLGRRLPPLVEAIDDDEAATLLVDGSSDGLDAHVDLHRPAFARDPPAE